MSIYCRIVVAALVALLSSCGRAPLINVVKDFQTASAVAVPAIRQYFLEINKVERDAVIDGKVARRERIDLVQIDESRLITQDDLKARLDALTALMKYGDLLAKLASTNVVESVTGSIDELNTSVTTLQTDLTRLSNPAAAANKKFSDASGAFAGVAKIIATAALNAKIDEALINSIKKADQPVRDLTAVLKDDLRAAVAARRISVSEARVNATDRFNEELRRTPSPDAMRLVTFGNEIKAAELRWELFNSTSPSDLLDGFVTAHKALVKAAESPKNPSALAAVVSAIDSFTTNVKAFAALVNALEKL